METYMMSEVQNPVMSRLIDQHIEQTISDEVAERVLAPVRARLRAGDFDEQLRKARLSSARKELQTISKYLYVVVMENGKWKMES